MKKTIHINLGGHAFSIDEDAYERLKAYLEAVRSRMGESEETRETLEDINLRIAELFRGVHRDASSAITIGDVEEIIKTLGEPGDYEVPNDSDENEEEKTEFRAEPPVRKQLFRDPDNRVFGGVCGGLGHYFNVDPLIFRLLFVLAVFLYGSSLLVYLILWIAVPKAVTVQQRIMMMGGAPASENWRRRQSGQSVGTDVMKGFLRVIIVIIGVVLIVVSFLSLVAMFMAFSLTDLLFGLLHGGNFWIPELSNLFLLPDQQILAFAGSSLVLGIPLLVLFYLGMHLVFRFKKGAATFLIISLVLWLVGVGMISYTGLSVVKNYTALSSIDQSTDLETPQSDTIYIHPSKASMKLGEGVHLFSNDGISIKEKTGELLLVGTPDIEVLRNAEQFRISIRKFSRGSTAENARNNASLIEYFFLQDDSLLLLDRYFSVQDAAMLRKQEVDVTIEIPEGKVVKVADDLRYLVDVE